MWQNIFIKLYTHIYKITGSTALPYTLYKNGKLQQKHKIE